jgi:spore coat protein JB
MNGKKELELKLQEIKFTMIDLVLFLDSHPKNKEAFACFKEMAEKYKALRSEYVEKFGPITWADTAEKDTWVWVDGPWPWEIEV